MAILEEKELEQVNERLREITEENEIVDGTDLTEEQNKYLSEQLIKTGEWYYDEIEDDIVSRNEFVRRILNSPDDYLDITDILGRYFEQCNQKTLECELNRFKY